eukprot:gene6258-10266_t
MNMQNPLKFNDEMMKTISTIALNKYNAITENQKEKNTTKDIMQNIIKETKTNDILETLKDEKNFIKAYTMNKDFIKIINTLIKDLSTVYKQYLL